MFLENGRRCWTVLLLTLATLASAFPARAAVDRKIVFLIDRSKSMYSTFNGDRTPRRQTFEAETAAARATAERICQEVEQYGDTAVSLWVFGDRNRLHPLGNDTISMTVPAARARLPELFTTDHNAYDQNWTYIAHSIFELVKRELDLPPSFSPKDNIPADAKLVNVFVFTDGDEDFDPAEHFDNSPYDEWLRNNERTLQIRWQKWKLFPRNDAELKARTDQYAPPAADRVVYSVHFGVPATAFSFSALEPPATRTVDLEVPRLIRIIPALSGDSLQGGAVAALPQCAATSFGAVQGSAGGRMLVQSGIEWPRGTAATTEWAIEAPPRPLATGVNPATGLPQAQLGRGVLRLLIGGATRGVIDPTAPEGAYPVRLNREELCDELRRSYPNSSFVFAADEKQQIPPVGYIRVDRIPTYTLLLTVQEATRPNGELDALIADRFLRYRRPTRTYRLTAPPGVQGEVEATVLARQQGKPLASSADIVRLQSIKSSGGDITVPFGEQFTLAVPAEPQKLWAVFGLGFRRPKGDYELTLRLRPTIAKAPDPQYRTRIVCENCDPARIHADAQEAILTIPFRILPPPVSWLVILLIAALVISVIRVVWRWHSRREFPRGMVVGKIENYADLRSAHGGGLRGKYRLYKRKPAYLALIDNGNAKTIFFDEPYLDGGGAGEKAKNLIGIRPDSDRMLLWCVSTKSSNTLELFGRTLEKTGSAEPPVGDKRVVQIRYADIERAQPVMALVVNEAEKKYPYSIQRLRT